MSYYYRGSRPLVSRERCTGGPGRSSSGTSSHHSSPIPRSGYDSTDILEVKNPTHYSGDSVILTKPEVIGCYSIDSDREFGHDQSMIRFLRSEYSLEEGKMKVNIDLNKGAEKLKDYIGHTEESFENLLQWILNNVDNLMDFLQRRLSVNFISVKRNFTEVMKTPYDFKEWKMCASAFKGCVYIKSFKQELEIGHKKKPAMEAYEKWGHTFEEYLTGKEGEEAVDPNEEYRCALKTCVGEHTLLYAPKVDCADPQQYDEEFKDLEAFISIKCCKIPTEQRKMRDHKKFTLLRWWTENQMYGIPRTLVGYRNEEGIAKTLEMVPTEDMPEMGEGLWDPNVCVNFLEAFLKFVKERTMNHPGEVFIFEHEFRGHIYCKKLPDSHQIQFLPEWYTSKLLAMDEEESV